jgi:DNA-binding GntR family transcriptional regulator
MNFAAEFPHDHQAARHDVAFHLLLCEFFGNREILLSLERALGKLHREIQRITRQSPGRLRASYQEHAAIAEAVLSGDAQAAAARVAEHLGFGRQFLLAGSC